MISKKSRICGENDKKMYVRNQNNKKKTSVCLFVCECLYSYRKESVNLLRVRMFLFTFIHYIYESGYGEKFSVSLFVVNVIHDQLSLFS